MIVEEKFLNEIKNIFGLNLYQAKLWVTLLSKGSSSPGELSKIGDVPRSRAYDILKSLEENGFIKANSGKPLNYVAIDPSQVIKNVTLVLKKRLGKKLKELEDLKKSKLVEELEELYRKGTEYLNPMESHANLKGRTNLYEHYLSVIKKAKKSVLIVTTRDGLKRKMSLFKDIFKELKRKNVKIKIGICSKEVPSFAKEISKFAEIKPVGLKGRFCVVDEKEVLFTISDDKEIHAAYDSGAWVTAPQFAQTLVKMFNNAWKK